MTIETPVLKFSGFYYPDILLDLITWMRQYVPEITDEDPHEPFIQLLRAFALVGHYNNVLLDHVAQETFLPTARLRESVRLLLALLGYRLKQPTPAVVDLIATLGSALSIPKTIPGRIQFGSQATETLPAIVFESSSDAETLPASNVLSQAWELDGAVWTDRTAKLNTDADTFTPWGGVPQPGDMLYLGHSRIEWDRIGLVLTVAGGIWGPNDHVWEYRDNYSDTANPDSVTDLGGGVLRFTMPTFLGSYDRTGLTIRVRSVITGAYQDVVVAWNGANNYVTTGLLGQTVPSVAVADYILSGEWLEVPNVVEEVPSATIRKITFGLPETIAREWDPGSVNGVTAYWIRLRIVRVCLTSPTFDRAKIDQGKQYLKLICTQGSSAVDDPLGSSTGLKDQQFSTSQKDVIEGTIEVYVDEGSGWVQWSEVENFLASTTTSQHYTLAYDDEGHGLITFGDGVTGKIPASGDGNIKAVYRYGAADNGNLGAGSINQNLSGLSIVSSISNPRAASGWQIRDGGDDTDLARVKVDGPALAMRTRDRAVTAEDCEILVVGSFVAENGSSPVVRAKAFEEMFGVKTIGLVLIGDGGIAIPTEILPEIDMYFNGDPVNEIAGVLVLNHAVTSLNFVPRAINIVATVTGGDSDAIEAALRAYLNPTAKKSDDVTWEHQFDGKVYRSKLIDVIFDADKDVIDVVLTAPAVDVSLLANELPTAGTITL